MERERTEVSFTINVDSKEKRSNETGDKTWLKNCKGDMNIYEKGPQNCWHPLFLPLQPGRETASSIHCLTCFTSTPLYRREDKYYQDALARFE